MVLCTHSYTASYQGKTNISTSDYSLCYKGLSTTQYSIPIHDHVLRLRGSHPKRSLHSLSRHQHQRLFFPLYSMYLVKRIEAWLTDSYKENDDIHLLVRKAAVLPLLPLNTIEDYWFNALEDIDDANTNIATLGYTDYVTSYWVEDNRNLWNHYATEGPRTTNHLEGCHGKLKQLVKAPHPNIYSIIQLLKHEDAIIACKLIQYQAEENV